MPQVKPRVLRLKLLVRSWVILNYMFTPHKLKYFLGTWEATSCIRSSLSTLPAVSLQDSDVLSLGVSSHHSWWKDNGPGCQSDSIPVAEWQKLQNLELATVVSCWLEYQYIEVLHCVIQLLISVSCTSSFSPHTTWKSCFPLILVICFDTFKFAVMYKRVFSFLVEKMNEIMCKICKIMNFDQN